MSGESTANGPSFGGIEAGGTKFVCAAGGPGGAVLKKAVVATMTPEKTMAEVIEFFRSCHRVRPLSSIGLASFGPVDLDPRSPAYGTITTAPKPGWSGYDIVGALKKALGLPVGFDTDVNGAALGEYRWGAAQGLDTFIYVTVGTGIGAGGMVSGKLMHGLIHPEMGHMLFPKDPGDEYEGGCPFHGAMCLEGLASGPAIQKRWGKPASELPPDHPAWELQAKYLGLAFANCVMVLSPQKIILGGGVSKQKHLYPMIREKMRGFLNGYIKHAKILSETDSYLVEPGCGEESGLRGALALAEQALPKREKSLA